MTVKLLRNEHTVSDKNYKIIFTQRKECMNR